MQTIEQELGRRLSTVEVAERFGLSESTVRRYASKFGGVRIGQRKIIFFERKLIDAISKLQQEQGQIPVARANCGQREAEAETVRQQTGCGEMGGGRKSKDAVRGSAARPDPHGLLA